MLALLPISEMLVISLQKTQWRKTISNSNSCNFPKFKIISNTLTLKTKPNHTNQTLNYSFIIKPIPIRMNLNETVTITKAFKYT